MTKHFIDQLLKTGQWCYHIQLLVDSRRVLNLVHQLFKQGSDLITLHLDSRRVFEGLPIRLHENYVTVEYRKVSVPNIYYLRLCTQFLDPEFGTKIGSKRQTATSIFQWNFRISWINLDSKGFDDDNDDLLIHKSQLTLVLEKEKDACFFNRDDSPNFQCTCTNDQKSIINVHKHMGQKKDMVIMGKWVSGQEKGAWFSNRDSPNINIFLQITTLKKQYSYE